MEKYLGNNELPLIKEYIDNQFDDLAPVATSGNFSDLNGTNTIATKDYVEEQIDSIEIGGQNIIKHSEANLDDWTINQKANIKVIESDVLFSRKCFECVVPKIEGGYLGVYKRYDVNKILIDISKLPIGTPLTLSFWAKSNVENAVLFCGIYGGVNANSNGIINITTEWQKYSSDFTTNGELMGYVFMYVSGSNVAQSVYFGDIKLELGNKATDWSPSIEDMATNDYVTEQIDEIEIGGRNYALNSSFEDGFEKWTLNGEPTIEKYDGKNWAHIKSDGTKSFYGLQQRYTDNNRVIKEGETYTVSARVRGAKENQNFYIGVVCLDKDNSPIAPQAWIKGGLEYSTDGIKDEIYSKTFVTNPGAVRYNIFLCASLNDPAEINDVYFADVKLEKGNKATDWSPAPEDTERAISRRAAVTYDYGGRNLKEIFGTPEALHNALAAEDYTNIAVGDYWPITLNGTFRDYGSYTAPIGIDAYRDKNRSDLFGKTVVDYEGTYVDDNTVSIVVNAHDNTIFYVNSSDCLPYFERTCTNVTVKLEVAGINHYWRYGDSGELTGNKPHIVFISRDCLPFSMRMRKGDTKWEDESATNPWLGSAMFKTLNDPEHGIINLIESMDIGAMLYAGLNELGMNALMETKAHNAVNATGRAWLDRGKLFLPSVAEVWGHPFFAENDGEAGLCNQFAIFRDSRRHISKGGGDNAGRVNWWLGSSRVGVSTNFTYVNRIGYASNGPATITLAVPVCFIFA